jgi:hypothetical protein
VGHENAGTGLFGEADLIEQMSDRDSAFIIVRIVVLALQAPVHGNDSDLLSPALGENFGNLGTVVYVKPLRDNCQFDTVDSSRSNGRYVVRPERFFLVNGHRNTKASGYFPGSVR